MNKTDNNMIADFMKDYTIYNGVDDMISYNDVRASQLAFDRDWNWLMHVVEKIEALGYGTSFKTGYCRINPIDGGYDEHIVWCDNFGLARQSFDDVENDETNDWGILYCDYEDHNNLTSADVIDKKRMIYICVVEFIKWFNKQN